jgi:hypothetical protein
LVASGCGYYKGQIEHKSGGKAPVLGKWEKFSAGSNGAPRAEDVKETASTSCRGVKV